VVLQQPRLDALFVEGVAAREDGQQITLCVFLEADAAYLTVVWVSIDRTGYARGQLGDARRVNDHDSVGAAAHVAAAVEHDKG
jgi:hypothetical protein